MSTVGTVDDSEDDDIWDYQTCQKSRFSQISRQRLADPRSSEMIKGPEKNLGEKRREKQETGKKGRPQHQAGKEASKDRDKDENVIKIKQRRKASQQKLSKNQNTKVEMADDKSSLESSEKASLVQKKSRINNRKHEKKTMTKCKVVTTEAAKETEDRVGFCPVCQMPYKALSIVQSPTWHIHECLETPYSSKKECPAGLDCDSTIPSHYKKFHHKQLARHRARLKATKSESPSAAETKRKIEFDQLSGKENMPDNTVFDKCNLETPNTTEDLLDSQRDLDQMLMDALDDNGNSGDITFEHNPQSQVIQSEVSSPSKIHCKTPEKNNCKQNDIQMLQTTSSPCSEQCGKTEKPSFFELSQSAQKQGFFAKKRRQRNQTSISANTEEEPLKKARRSTGKTDQNYKYQRNKTKAAAAETKNDNSVGDKNSNSIRKMFVVSDSCTHQKSQLTETVCDYASEVSETRLGPENNLHIKIEDIKSKASDIFYSNSTSTKVDKSSVNDTESLADGHDSEIHPVDEVSSDSMPSWPDMFSSDSKQCGTEVEIRQTYEGMDENPDIMEARFGGGFIIHDSQVDNSETKGTNDADKILTNENVEDGFNITSETYVENQGTAVRTPVIAADSGKSAQHKTLSDDSATPQAEKTSEAKTSPLVNAFHLLMQKGKSLSNKLLSKRASTDTKRNAMDILMSNSGSQSMQRTIKPKREPSSQDQSVDDDTVSESGSSREYGRNRNCPFYKKIPGTPFTVDAFRYGNIPDCKAYFLTHFHYDHYGGLTKKFSNPIYCSQITYNLVKKKINTDERYLHPISLNTPVVIEGTEVTFLEANQYFVGTCLRADQVCLTFVSSCPGSVLILFRLKNGKVYLHTGDFRAHPRMEMYPCLVDLHVHTLYLDTTYCDPQYTFPPQEDVISYAVQLALDARTANPKTLIVCGSYTIGKERIFTAIAEALNCKICVTRDKKAVLDCLDDSPLSARVSLRWQDSGLHVLPMGKLNYKGLDEHLKNQDERFDCVLALEPTGWTCNKKFTSLAELKPKMKKDRITLYGVPYSEHSSYLEMKRFVQHIRPEKILPTVNNGNVHSRKKMEVIFEEWNNEIKQGNIGC